MSKNRPFSNFEWLISAIRRQQWPSGSADYDRHTWKARRRGSGCSVVVVSRSGSHNISFIRTRSGLSESRRTHTQTQTHTQAYTRIYYTSACTRVTRAWFTSAENPTESRELWTINTHVLEPCIYTYTHRYIQGVPGLFNKIAIIFIYSIISVFFIRSFYVIRTNKLHRRVIVVSVAVWGRGYSIVVHFNFFSTRTSGS